MKFLIVDDEFLPRGGVAKALLHLRPGAQVFEADSLDAAYPILQAEKPVDLVVLDLNLDRTRGIATLTNLHEWLEAKEFSSRIVVLSGAGEDDPLLVLSVLDQVGTGFIVKGTPEKVFLNALALTLDGGVYIPELVLRAIAAKQKEALGGSPLAPSRPANFTARESEVAALLIQGYTYKKIAIELEKVDKKPISDATVRSHVSNMAWKLGVTDAPAKAGVMAEIAKRQLKFPRG